MKKDNLKLDDFFKAFVAACAIEQGDFYWVSVYNEYYPYDGDAVLIQNGEKIERGKDGFSGSSLIRFGEEFLFNIPNGLKEEMRDFEEKVNGLRGLFKNGSEDFIPKLKMAEISINDFEVVKVRFEFTWTLNGVYGDKQPMVMEWKKQEQEESNVDMVGMRATFAGIQFHEKFERWIKNGIVFDFEETFCEFEKWLKLNQHTEQGFTEAEMNDNVEI